MTGSRLVFRAAALTGSDNLTVTLNVRDSQVRQILLEQEDRQKFAEEALTVGVLALNQAQVRVDTTAIKTAGGDLVDDMQTRLEAILGDYFDPADGRFSERIEQLVKRDGDLEMTLRRQIGTDSELSRTLLQFLGSESAFVRLLRPDTSEGLLAQLQVLVEAKLEEQRRVVLGEFSLDSERSALSRFLREIEASRGKSQAELEEQIGGLVKQFSLDDKGSTISRLQSEIQEAMDTQRAESVKFQVEVATALREMRVRNDEAKQTPRGGVIFEELLTRELASLSQQCGDVCSDVGTTVGTLRNCKVGDAVIRLGRESAAPNAQIVVEAKQDKKYSLQKGLDDLEVARQNRDAQVGLLVWSRSYALASSSGASLEPVTRHGNDVVVLWDSTDPATDLFLKVGLSLARALCVRRFHDTSIQGGDNALDLSADLKELDRAANELQRQVAQLDQIETWAGTITSSAEKIMDRIRKSRTKLLKEIGQLQIATDRLQIAVERQTSPNK